MKPFYSKRRLKKMGFYLFEKKDRIVLNVISHSGNIKHGYNISKMLKNSKKKIDVRMTYIGSCATWLNF